MSYNDKCELEGQKTFALMFQPEKLFMLNVMYLKQDFLKKTKLKFIKTVIPYQTTN